ncbi:Agamous-like MADS-box protein AGL61 [Abeliophyllum distichum]|uniref:Agamous-like MADS-box protein AGL61 n=1 Tax=Abeliophyllum distichum TaxID=126358 RepID=A0ABD1PRY3_9LAMI
MGTSTRIGKKNIEIKKITKQSSKFVIFSKRHKGMFKKAQELQSKTGTSIALVVFSLANRPYTYGDLSLIDAVGESSTSQVEVVMPTILLVMQFKPVVGCYSW